MSWASSRASRISNHASPDKSHPVPRMDLIVRNARLVNRIDEGPLDIAIDGERIVAIGRALAADGASYDAAGRLVCAGLIASHIHLDKSRIADRCPLPDGRRVNPVAMVAAACRVEPTPCRIGPARL